MVMADTLQLSIPASARTLLGFVGWCHSPSFPEQGRIGYLAGDLEVDMSPEDRYTHGAVKAAIAARLQLLIADSDLDTRLGSTDSAEEPRIVVARAIGGSNDEKPIP
jgi:hypothetical protein